MHEVSITVLELFPIVVAAHDGMSYPITPQSSPSLTRPSVFPRPCIWSGAFRLWPAAIIYLFQLATSLVAVTQRSCPLLVAFSRIPPIAAIHPPITCPIASSPDSGAAVPVLTARCSYYLQEGLASSTHRSHAKNVGIFAPNSRP